MTLTLIRQCPLSNFVRDIFVYYQHIRISCCKIDYFLSDRAKTHTNTHTHTDTDAYTHTHRDSDEHHQGLKLFTHFYGYKLFYNIGFKILYIAACACRIGRIPPFFGGEGKNCCVDVLCRKLYADHHKYEHFLYT